MPQKRSRLLARVVLLLLRTMQIPLDAAGPSPRRVRLHRRRIELMREIDVFQR